MQTLLQVLSEEEKHQVHERTLNLLWNVGVRVDSALAREILLNAGAEIEPGTEIVYFPRELVEESLRLAPKKFSLGARRPGCRGVGSAGVLLRLPPRSVHRREPARSVGADGGGAEDAHRAAVTYGRVRRLRRWASSAGSAGSPRMNSRSSPKRVVTGGFAVWVSPSGRWGASRRHCSWWYEL